MSGQSLTLLHTAKAHIATFDALRDRIAPDAAFTHIVRPDFLSRAQGGIGIGLADEITALIQSAPDTVLCTCTTIGKVAGNAGAIRIDAPMMQAAALKQKPVLLVYCLKSTYIPSLDLLHTEIASKDTFVPVVELFLGQHWPLFEAGKFTDFQTQIARAVLAALENQKDIGCVVLAQASMAGAAQFLQTLDIPVFSPPEMALRAALAY